MKDKLKALEERGKRLMDAQRRYRKSLENENDEVAPGKLYAFSVPLDISLRFLPIQQHPDDETLFFVVPVDDFGLSGPVDVEVTSHPLGTLVVRCNHGIWLAAKDFEEAQLVGRVEEDVIRRTRNILAVMVRGGLEVTEEELATEESEEYEEWDEALEAAMEVVRRWQPSSAQVISLFPEIVFQPAASSRESKLVQLRTMPEGIDAAISSQDGRMRLEIVFEERAPSRVVAVIEAEGHGNKWNEEIEITIKGDTAIASLGAWSGPGNLLRKLIATARNEVGSEKNLKGWFEYRYD